MMFRLSELCLSTLINNTNSKQGFDSFPFVIPNNIVTEVYYDTSVSC